VPLGCEFRAETPLNSTPNRPSRLGRTAGSTTG